MINSEYEKRMNQLIKFDKTGEKVEFTEEEKQKYRETLLDLITKANEKETEQPNNPT